jgi:hypothetical protein
MIILAFFLAVLYHEAILENSFHAKIGVTNENGSFSPSLSGLPDLFCCFLARA